MVFCLSPSVIITSVLLARSMMYYQDVFSALSKHKVCYLVVGAVAMNLHGVPRMTADLDIMLDLSAANLDRFVKALTEIGYKPKPPVSLKDFTEPSVRLQWAAEKNMTVLTLHNPKIPYQELDVFVVNPVLFGGAYKNRASFKSGGLEIPAASVDDLVTMKELAGRKQDKSDIGALKKLKKP